jgi:protein-S-isoprenylcysteine O-methyltransferase Ste14
MRKQTQKGHRRRHEGREDLTGESPVGDIGQIVFAFLFFVVWMADTFFFEWTTFLNRHFSIFARVSLGLILLILSGYLARKGLSIVFGEERKKPYVIRKSVFGMVRHPVYLSEVLFYFGFLMLSLSLAAAAVWICAAVFLHFISRYEEKLLLSRFGNEYEKYMNEVPMWLPFFWKKGKKKL